MTTLKATLMKMDVCVNPNDRRYWAEATVKVNETEHKITLRMNFDDKVILNCPSISEDTLKLAGVAIDWSEVTEPYLKEVRAIQKEKIAAEQKKRGIYWDNHPAHWVVKMLKEKGWKDAKVTPDREDYVKSQSGVNVGVYIEKVIGDNTDIPYHVSAHIDSLKWVIMDHYTREPGRTAKWEKIADKMIYCMDCAVARHKREMEVLQMRRLHDETLLNTFKNLSLEKVKVKLEIHGVLLVGMFRPNSYNNNFETFDKGLKISTDTDGKYNVTLVNAGLNSEQVKQIARVLFQW